MKKYKCGLYVGRFQPLHIGHTYIISKMFDECEKVIIAVGSAQESGTTRNPFKFSFREEMIQDTYEPYLDRLNIVPIKDRENPSDDASWGDYLFSRVYEWCGLTPDVIYEGEEDERVHWYDNINVDIVKVPRTVLPISGTMLRDAIKRNDKDFVFQYLPYAIRGHYDQMRKEVKGNSMNFFKRFFGHLRTVHKHRAMVRKLCFKCGLYWQGLIHDLSKYSPTEFWNGVKFYTGTRSPHVGERQSYGYSKAWLHHKGVNKHHAEYWQDIRSSGKTESIPMPMKYFAEMICDRVAASMIYLGDKFTKKSALDYYRSHYDENQFHSDTRQELEWWLSDIAAIGVDKAFNELKENLKTQRK